MASGVFVDPSTDQRMMSIGMDRMGMGMVDLGMVQDGTVCGDEKVKSFFYTKKNRNFLFHELLSATRAVSAQNIELAFLISLAQNAGENV